MNPKTARAAGADYPGRRGLAKITIGCRTGDPSQQSNSGTAERCDRVIRNPKHNECGVQPENTGLLTSRSAAVADAEPPPATDVGWSPALHCALPTAPGRPASTGSGRSRFKQDGAP